MDQDSLDREPRRLQERLERGEISDTEYQEATRPLRDSAAQSKPPADRFETPESDAYRPRRPTQLMDLQPDLEIGPEDNRFRLVQEIGGGAMGRVWVARDLEEEKVEGGERLKALKVVTPLLQDQPRALERLKREAVRAAQLTHPNIINVRGWRQGRDGWLFVVMDYLKGRDLDRLLLDEGDPGLSWERTLQLLTPIAEALDYAHGKGIIHRDLKPGNVFITEDGEVKILDFGLAYRLHRSSSAVNVQEDTSSGTREYMPPEAFAAGQPDKTHDIYALACLAYEILTGDPPYDAQAAVNRNPDLLPAKPEVLTDTVWEKLKSGFAYYKEDRPDSAGEWVRRLREAQAAGRREEVVPERGQPEETPPGEPSQEEVRRPEPIREGEPAEPVPGSERRRPGAIAPWPWLIAMVLRRLIIVGLLAVILLYFFHL